MIICKIFNAEVVSVRRQCLGHIYLFIVFINAWHTHISISRVKQKWWSKTSESGVTAYPTTLKTLKKLFGNHHRVTAAHLKRMVDGPYVLPSDRNALRDHYSRVKACVTWCTKLGQSAVLHNSEYLSKSSNETPNQP